MKQKSSYDAVIIGSGLGGLTCAAYLAKKKKKVLVLESHNLVGGCATVYTRKGVKFEVGLHEMDMPRKSRNMKHCIFKKLGVYDKINLVRLPHVWRIKSEATDITVPDGYQNIINVLGEEFPEEKAGLKKYFAGLSRMLYMIRRLPYDLKFFDFFFYSLTTLPLNIYHYFTQKNVGTVLDSIIKSDKLKRILNINISYSVNYRPSNEFNYDKMRYKMRFSHSLQLSANLNLTSNWSISGNTSFDFEAKKFTQMNVNVTRNLHCWTMTANFVPFGYYKSYNFRIGVNASMLQDLKYEKQSRYSSNPVVWY